MSPSPRKLVCALTTAVCLLGCGADSGAPRGPRFDAQKLDAIDAALERLGAGRWVSWTMELVGDALELHVELSDTSQESQTCTEIESALKSVSRAPLAWHAELTHAGAVVRHCAKPQSSRRA